MEQSPVKLMCVVTFDSPTDTWVTSTKLPSDVKALMAVIQNLRHRLHFAASLFTHPADIIAGLAELFPVFANIPTGDQPIVHGVRVGDMFIQVELFVEGKRSQSTANVVMLADPEPVDTLDPKVLYDVEGEITIGGKTIANEKWSTLPLATIVARYLRMIHTHLSAACIEDNVPALILDVLDLFIGVENGQLGPGDYHVNIGSHVVSLVIATNAVGQPPVNVEPPKFLH